VNDSLILNETPKQLKKIQHRIAYLQRQYARMKNLERKQDTRRKIQLGGLIKKAGLDGETTAVLYGLLLEAQEKLLSEQSDDIRQDWRIKGDLALTNEKNKDNELTEAS
jgi:Conjugal transfer protein TraD